MVGGFAGQVNLGHAAFFGIGVMVCRQLWLVAHWPFPVAFVLGGVGATVERLRNPAIREQLSPWFAAPRIPLESVRLSYVANPQYRACEGKTLAEAAECLRLSLAQAVGQLIGSQPPLLPWLRRFRSI